MRQLLVVMLATVAAATGSVGLNGQPSRAAEPMLVDLRGDGFNLTDPQNGIDIDIDGDGRAERVAWTASGSDDSFLAVDHNENGLIDVPAELIGGTTGPPIGFALFAAMDGIASSGRPERIADRRPDGRIDKSDALYEKLIVWTDSNHNGRSEEDELQSLDNAGILQILSGYEGISNTDSFGNQFMYRTSARMMGSRGVAVVREVVTVRLAMH